MGQIGPEDNTRVKLQENQRVYRKTAGNCGCNYYWDAASFDHNYLLQNGVGFLTCLNFHPSYNLVLYEHPSSQRHQCGYRLLCFSPFEHISAYLAAYVYITMQLFLQYIITLFLCLQYFLCSAFIVCFYCPIYTYVRADIVFYFPAEPYNLLQKANFPTGVNKALSYV